MSAVVEFLEDTFDTLVAITVTVLSISFPFLSIPLATFCTDCKDFMLEQIGVVMGWLGITAEDIVETNVTDQRLITDDIVASLMTQVALEHQDTQAGIIELLSTKTAQVRQQLGEYYDYGKNTYSHGLPDTNIHISYVPLDIVVPLIETEYAQTITVLESKIAAPSKTEWCGYKLWQLYGYQPSSQRLTYTDTYVYEMKYIDYNYGTDQYDITMYRPVIQTIETTITITAYDATYDNKHTHTVTTMTAIEGVLSTDTTDTDVLIPIGSESNSYSSVDTNVEYGTTVISIPSYMPVRSMIVKFYWTVDTDYYYWIYQLGDGIIELDNSNTYITNLKMLPIIELRNAKVDVNADLTSATYLEAKAILDFIGMDVDTMITSINENPNIADIEDAYVYFGMEVGSNDPLLAKMLYMLWEFLYYDTSLLVDNSTGYIAMVKEGSYNSSLVWQTQTRTVINGILGPINTYENEVGLTDGVPWVKFRKQETEEYYVEYEITNLVATTYIARDGLWGVVVKSTEDGPLVIPVSKYFIDQLSPLEQMELFAKSLRLTVYALNVTHLEWYETPEFFQLIQIVLTVVAIVVFVLSLGEGASLSKILLDLAIMATAAMAFKWLLEQTDNPWLKALIVVVAAYVMVQTGKFDIADAGFFTVDQFTQITTEYVDLKMEELTVAAAAFDKLAEEQFDELEKKIDSMADYLSTEFVQNLTNIGEVTGFIEGPDLSFYRAVGLQKDAYELSLHKPYENIYDYDKYYRIGVV